LQLKQKLALAEADLRKTEKDCCVAKYELKLKQEELKRVRKSITYKAGRVLTKVPRSVKRMVKNK
jgi:hypothetical protein